jgi:hypothetical protein
MSLIATRPVDWFKGWSVRHSLRDPQTRQPALNNILRRLPGNSALAIDVLSNETVSQADRIKALSAVLTSSEFAQTRKVYGNPYRPPEAPRFFTVLASRAEPIVSALHGFWRHFDGEAMKEATGQLLNSASAGKKLQSLSTSEYLSTTKTIFPDYNRIVGYQIGEHKFYLRSGPITPCSWEKGDALAAFGLASLPGALKQNLVDVRSEGFYSSADIWECVQALSTFNSGSDRVASHLSQGPLTIAVKRFDFSSPVEVTLISETDEQILTQWTFRQPGDH